MSTVGDLERRLGRLETEMARQRYAYQALEQLLAMLARFTVDGDRQTLRSNVLAWAERLKDHK